MTTVPLDWMPQCSMQRIICHWTAGSHKANATDREHYHILIEGDGKLVRGDHQISDNVSTSDGDYAAHTLNTNSGSIGVSLCCMGGDMVKEVPFIAGPYPMTVVQWEKLLFVVADLCRQYRIPVTPKTVLSHAEVQANLGHPQRGKWDYTRLAFEPSVKGAAACGELLRNAVKMRMSA